MYVKNTQNFCKYSIKYFVNIQQIFYKYFVNYPIKHLFNIYKNLVKDKSNICKQSIYALYK